MPDILVRHIDDFMAERIKDLAREREWSINDVILHALKHGLGFSDELLRRDPKDIANLRGTWDSTETEAFRQALDAFKDIKGSQLFDKTRKTKA